MLCTTYTMTAIFDKTIIHNHNKQLITFLLKYDIYIFLLPRRY